MLFVSRLMINKHWTVNMIVTVSAYDGSCNGNDGIAVYLSAAFPDEFQPIAILIVYFNCMAFNEVLLKFIFHHNSYTVAL